MKIALFSIALVACSGLEAASIDYNAQGYSSTEIDLLAQPTQSKSPLSISEKDKIDLLNRPLLPKQLLLDTEGDSTEWNPYFNSAPVLSR